MTEIMSKVIEIKILFVYLKLKGQAPIAAVLLMHMPAEHAFWSLVAICDHYLPGYFSPGLEAIQLHGDMLFAFLKRYSPNAHKLMVFSIKLSRI
jgi:hypothetical protein